MARILLVDDERDVVELITFVLVKDGHAVTGAYNGIQALAALGVEPPGNPELPNLVILDVLMPQLDGPSTAKRLALNPNTARIPVVVLTAKGATQDLFAGLPNIAGHVDKPFDPKTLRQTVISILGGRR